MMDEDDQKGYTWEAGYAEGLNIREVLEEDEGGSIEKSIAKYVLEAKKKQRTQDKPAKIRLGIVIENFLDKFFEQNPIAQVGIILCKDKKAERYVGLTGNIQTLKEQLRSIGEAACIGDFSLQNCLQLAMINLKDLPGHVSREVLIVMASLSTVDSGNIFGTFEALKSHNIRCSVLGLSAEVFVCKQLSKVTNGRYDVVLDESHMELVVSRQAQPPPTQKAVECNAVRVGFPPHTVMEQRSFCLCHPSGEDPPSRGFICEQCGARHCSLPAECRVCRLTLVAAPQLARAFRHLMPLPAFDSKPGENRNCWSCERALGEEGFMCRSCSSLFCFDCDLLLHESLHICPSCD